MEELIDERGALSQMEYIGEAGGTARRPIHRYRFPVQETSLRGGEELRMPGGDRLGKLVSLNPQAGTVDIEKPATLAYMHPEAVFAHDLVPTYAHKQALVRLGEYVANRGITGEGAYAVARSLLLREAPRLKGEPIRRPGETALEAALRIAAQGDFGVSTSTGTSRCRQDFYRGPNDLRTGEERSPGRDHRQQPQGDRQSAGGGHVQPLRSGD